MSSIMNAGKGVFAKEDYTREKSYRKKMKLIQVTFGRLVSDCVIVSNNSLFSINKEK